LREARQFKGFGRTTQRRFESFVMAGYGEVSFVIAGYGEVSFVMAGQGEVK